MKKKDLGFVEKILPVLLSTGIVFGVVICSGHFLELFRDRASMNQAARKYLLEMETIGYLPVEQLGELEIALSECGLTNISFEGTSTQSVAYGTPIRLEISGVLKTEIYLGIPLLTKTKKELEIPIHICFLSTAKH